MAQELNYQGVEFPVSVKDYHKIEVESSININVFGYEGKQFYPIFVSFVFWRILEANNEEQIDTWVYQEHIRQLFISPSYNILHHVNNTINLKY